ncbi:MAG: response regulator [Armatimonadota bacterium]
MSVIPAILLVEDDADQALLFAQVLDVCGYPVTVARSAADAQARFATETFALLLADWDLGGGMNGDALITWAKAAYPGMQTVLISNHPEVNDLATACGADAACRKIDGIAHLRRIVTGLVPPP